MPSGFNIGPLTIRFYGLLIVGGAMLATWIASRRARRYGENPDAAWDMLFWVFIAGVIGARLWHILTPPASLVKQGITTWYYLTHPLDAIAIWHGGLGIPGAVIGGVIALYLYTRKHGMSFATWTDIIAPGLALAQIIGRLGNFFNQELYGMPTNLPWAIYIDPAHRLPEFMDQAYYHPLFAYEGLWNLMNIGIILWVEKRFAAQRKPGDLFLVYLIVYPIGRFLLEFLRLDPSPVAGLNINQTLMAIVALASAITLYLRHRPRPQASQPAA